MDIQIPKFWEVIEKSLVIDPSGIKEIKEILTLLKYTTIQSIMKFTKPKEVKLIELEFLNRKRDFEEKYAHLKDFTFGSGIYSILIDIATKIKKNFVQDNLENIDQDSILEKVLQDGKQVTINNFHRVIWNEYFQFICLILDYTRIGPRKYRVQSHCI